MKKKNMKLGEETRKWLEKVGHSEAEWAEKVGVDRMTAYHWLHRGVRPIKIHLEAIRGKTPDCPLVKETKWKTA